MKITILCNSAAHPVNAWLSRWQQRQQGAGHDVEIVRSKAEAAGGDLLLLISCGEILRKADRAAYRKVLVVHASDLPAGRGWSPHVWQILEGRTELTVTLLEAEDAVDSGPIWHQVRCQVPKDALCDEINARLFDAEIALMDFAVQNFGRVVPRPQAGEASYYPRRTPAHSELDPQRTLAEQFDLLRVCDPDRFPAFFRLHGRTYRLRIEKADEE